MFPCVSKFFPVSQQNSLCFPSGKSKNQIPCFPCAVATLETVDDDYDYQVWSYQIVSWRRFSSAGKFWWSTNLFIPLFLRLLSNVLKLLIYSRNNGNYSTEVLFHCFDNQFTIWSKDKPFWKNRVIGSDKNFKTSLKKTSIYSLCE